MRKAVGVNRTRREGIFLPTASLTHSGAELTPCVWKMQTQNKQAILTIYDYITTLRGFASLKLVEKRAEF